MTDLEKAAREHGYGLTDSPLSQSMRLAFVNGWDAACEAKDAEWRAKTAGLVESLENILDVAKSEMGLRVPAIIDIAETALNAFTSGQAPDVVVVPKWMQAKITAEIQHRLKRALEQGSGFTFEQEAHILHGVDMTFEAIKAIGKGDE